LPDPCFNMRGGSFKINLQLYWFT